MKAEELATVRAALREILSQLDTAAATHTIGGKDRTLTTSALNLLDVLDAEYTHAADPDVTSTAKGKEEKHHGG